MKTVIAVLLFPMMSFAGVMNGGGGKGIICEQKSETLEVLDLYEAKNVNALTEAPRRGPLSEELLVGMRGMNEVWREPKSSTAEPTAEEVTRLQKLVDETFYSRLTFIPKGTRLPLTEDATLPPLPAHCQQVQIAIHDESTIWVDQEYWEKLDARNQAAIIFHELLYEIRRNYGAKDSDETRQFVGRIFSTTPPTWRFEGIPQTGYLDCRSNTPGAGTTDFVVYPWNSETLVSFREISGATTLGRTIALGGPDLLRNLLDPTANASAELSVLTDLRSDVRKLVLKKKAGSLIELSLQVDGGPVGRGFCQLK